MGGLYEKQPSHKLRGRDEVKKPHEDIVKSVQKLTEQAREDALQRVPLNPEVQNRVNNAIERRFKPYVTEGEVISTQLSTSEYQGAFVPETDTFLGALVGIIVCPDGRLLIIQLGDPKVARTSRRLRGKPLVRSSTRGENNRMVPDDPYLSSSITTELQRRGKTIAVPEMIQQLGPHIDSVHPEEHGCGDKTAEVISWGHTPEIGMEYGGIAHYFESLGEGFYAFDNTAKNAGGRGTTIDVTQDTHSQGLIFGLRNVYKSFNSSISLRENLELLSRNKIILMTEFLDQIFSERIIREAKKRGVNEPVNMHDYFNFASNAMLIGRIARELTREEEAEGFSWIPRPIREDKTETALRVMAYHALRNSAYRILGGIKPGNHSLIRHPEKLIRIGPIGADFNVENIPFIESTVPGPFQESDIKAVEKLYGLSYKVFREQGIDLREEARIILVTGIFDPDVYATEEKARAELTLVTHIVQNNAAWVRERFKRSIQTGETVVLGGLYKPGTRTLTHIV